MTIQKRATKGDQREEQSSPLRDFLKKLGLAALTAFVVFFLFVYVNTGIVLFVPREALPSLLRELLLFFLLLLAVFWSHGRIAAWMRRPGMQVLNPAVHSLIEAVLVITVTILFNYLLMFVPLFYLLGVEQLPEGRMRTVMVTSAAISLFFYYYVERERSRQKLQAELLRTEQLQKENFRAQLNALKAQMNPHFLFNSLNVLASLIRVDRDRAVTFTRELAQVYRSFLAGSERATVPLREEMELARAYLSLLQTRFGEDLRVEVEVPEHLYDHRLPPGALQLLIENTVKHNGFSPGRPLQLSIRAEGGRLIVRNNRQPRREAVPSGRHGLRNVRSRYHLLTEAEVQVEDTGTAFIVRLPLLKPATDASTDH